MRAATFFEINFVIHKPLAALLSPKSLPLPSSGEGVCVRLPACMMETDWLQLWSGPRALMSKHELCVEALKGLLGETAYVAGRIDPPGCPVAMVHNVVSTSIIQGTAYPIDLARLAWNLPCTTYNRKRFAAITIRVGDPQCTALLFTSGKLVVTGVKSWYECLLAALCVCRMVSRALTGCSYKVSNCEIQNIVARSTVVTGPHQRLNIQRMYELLGLECTYQRSMFPGLIYRRTGCPVVVLCFVSGKVVLTGGRSPDDVGRGWEETSKVASRFVA